MPGGKLAISSVIIQTGKLASKFSTPTETELFDTNEDMPPEEQEANARLASSAPGFGSSRDRCAILLADYDEHDGEEGEAYRDAIAVITAATTGKTEL